MAAAPAGPAPATTTSARGAAVSIPCDHAEHDGLTPGDAGDFGRGGEAPRYTRTQSGLSHAVRRHGHSGPRPRTPLGRKSRPAVGYQPLRHASVREGAGRSTLLPGPRTPRGRIRDPNRVAELDSRRRARGDTRSSNDGNAATSLDRRKYNTERIDGQDKLRHDGPSRRPEYTRSAVPPDLHRDEHG